ncbi:MAG TPA: hypothetical protein PLU72_12625 [Candidatus Ozemobacteraceae bacterium]|nr:hypothetical protein [Candidatus Ozemobacteraceae bacterium]
MRPAAILEELHSAGVMIEFREGGLRCRPKPTGRLLELIQANRVALAADLVATMTRTMTDDSVLRGQVHRLLDRADELDRAGDEAGALRILDDIRRTIQNATAATVPDKASRNDGAGKDEVSAVSTSPRASNAESPRKPVPVPVLGAGPAITPPSDHADVVSERAAMVETDAGTNRVDAEAAAVRAVGPCHVCGGGRLWVSRWGVIVCERCHPPANSKLIERNISIHV